MGRYAKEDEEPKANEPHPNAEDNLQHWLRIRNNILFGQTIRIWYVDGGDERNFVDKPLPSPVYAVQIVNVPWLPELMNEKPYFFDPGERKQIVFSFHQISKSFEKEIFNGIKICKQNGWIEYDKNTYSISDEERPLLSRKAPHWSD